MNGQYVRCLMVETGQEKTVFRLLKVRGLGNALFPQRSRIRKIRGIWRMDRILLLPGYVFVFTEEKIPVWKYYGMERVLRVLKYDREPEGYLKGTDLDFANAMADMDGKLGLLRALDENGFIRITDPLLDELGGEVLSVDKGKRQARIRFFLLGQERILPMNYQLFGPDGQPLTPEEEIIEEMVEDEGDEWLTAWTPDFAEMLTEGLDLESGNADPVRPEEPDGEDGTSGTGGRGYGSD